MQCSLRKSRRLLHTFLRVTFFFIPEKTGRLARIFLVKCPVSVNLVGCLRPKPHVTVQGPIVVDFGEAEGWAPAGAADGSGPPSINSCEGGVAEVCLLVSP